VILSPEFNTIIVGSEWNNSKNTVGYDRQSLNITFLKQQFRFSENELIKLLPNLLAPLILVEL
jgi:hypothetical protein